MTIEITWDLNWVEAAEEMAAWVDRVAPHLDREELIANALSNSADAADPVECFISTVELYVDQDCSSF